MAETSGAIERDFFARYLHPVTISNCNLERLGKKYDGGYISCSFDIEYPEAAFSFGIAGRDSWGCHAAHKYSVPVFQYDPFNVSIPFCNKLGELMNFNAVGIAEKTYIDADDIRFETFSDMLKSYKINGSVVVKMDIEGNEWLSLQKLLQDGAYENISQLIVEMHDLLTNNEQDADLIKTVLKELHDKFYIVHLHANNFACSPYTEKLPASVIEVTYINRNIPNLEVKPDEIPHFPHALDSPNYFPFRDCPMDRRLFSGVDVKS